MRADLKTNKPHRLRPKKSTYAHYTLRRQADLKKFICENPENLRPIFLYFGW